MAVSDRVLPVFQGLPSGLHARTTRVVFEIGQTPTLPDKIADVAVIDRVDLVVI